MYSKKFLLLLLAGIQNGQAEDFLKISSWPCDFASPTDQIYLELGGQAFTNIPPSIFQNSFWIEDLSFNNCVQSIGRNVFEGCSSLSSVMFPQQLRQIAAASFKGCLKLSECTLPDQLVSIGAQAFQNCLSLSSVTLDQSLSSIGTEAFAGTKLSSIHFPASLTNLGIKAFFNCPLKSVSYKNKDQNFSIDQTYFIGPENKFSFSNNQNISELIFLEGVEDISENAFSACANLRVISFPETIQTIDETAFLECPSIEFLAFTDFESLSKVGNNFSECQNLKQVAICQDSQELRIKIANEFPTIFRNCPNLSTVLLNEKEIPLLRNEVSAQGAFQNNESLTEAIILNGPTTIAHSAFTNCSALTSITLPNSIRTIDYHAFRGAPLCECNLPEGLTTIGEAALGCGGLKIMTLPSTINTISSGGIENTGSELLDISKVVNFSNWKLAFYSQSSLDQIKKVHCRSNQDVSLFRNAVTKVVD